MRFGLLVGILVIGFLVGGLLALRRSARTGMPDARVLERAQQRARELDRAERADPDRTDAER